jgi:hypothetical protein
MRNKRIGYVIAIKVPCCSWAEDNHSCERQSPKQETDDEAAAAKKYKESAVSGVEWGAFILTSATVVFQSLFHNLPF